MAVQSTENKNQPYEAGKNLQDDYFNQTEEKQQMKGIIYRGHVLRVQSDGSGYAVHIRRCESVFALDDPMPCGLDEAAAMTKAEQLVDATIARRVDDAAPKADDRNVAQQAKPWNCPE